ncbi:MAG: glycosyltransferase [Planctomycetota bacterium]
MAVAYSIVIPAFNESAALPGTLSAVRAAMSAVEAEGGDGFRGPFRERFRGQFRGRGEIVVVDNNSSDDTAEVARAHGADRVVLEPVNQIGRARNAGAAGADASSPWLVFLDADTQLSAGVLGEALRRLSEGDAGGGARVELDAEVGIVPRLGCWLWEMISRRRNLAAGCFLFCRRDAFEAVGGFDLRYFVKEEIYLSSQLKRWAAERGTRFEVFQDPAIVTSTRKLDRFLREVPLILFVGLAPWAARTPRFCRYWYRQRGSAGA